MLDVLGSEGKLQLILPGFTADIKLKTNNYTDSIGVVSKESSCEVSGDQTLHENDNIIESTPRATPACCISACAGIEAGGLFSGGAEILVDHKRQVNVHD